MPPTPPEKKYPSLTKKDCDKILRNIDAGLDILATCRKLPTVTELRAKSLLIVLRREINEAAKSVGQ